MQLYSSIFKQSWSITKKHKVLWLFGLFVLFWGGKGVDFELFFSDAKLLGSNVSPFQPEFWQTGSWQTVVATFGSNVFTGIGLVLLLLAFAVFVLFVIMSSQIALVDAFAVYKAQNPADRYSLNHALKAGSKHMVRVLTVNLLSKAVSYGLLAVASAPLFLAEFATAKFVYTLTLYVLIMPIVVSISILTKYAINAVIIGELSVSQAYKRGWEMFSQNVGTSFECALLSFVAFVATNVGSIIVAALATVPALFVGVIASFMLHTNFAVFVYSYIFYALSVCIALASSAVFSAWHFGNWTLLYLELTKGARRSKIHRLFAGENIPAK